MDWVVPEVPAASQKDSRRRADTAGNVHASPAEEGRKEDAAEVTFGSEAAAKGEAKARVRRKKKKLRQQRQRTPRP